VASIRCNCVRAVVLLVSGVYDQDVTASFCARLVQAECLALPGGCTEMCARVVYHHRQCCGLASSMYMWQGSTICRFCCPSCFPVAAVCWTQYPCGRVTGAALKHSAVGNIYLMCLPSCLMIGCTAVVTCCCVGWVLAEQHFSRGWEAEAAMHNL